MERKGQLGIAFGTMLAVFLTLLAGVCTTLSYIIVQTPSIVNTFVADASEDRGEGTLTVRIDITHDLGDDYAVPGDLDFPVRVDFGTRYAHAAFGSYRADESGVVSLSLKPGEHATIEHIPEYTEVTVTELLSERPGFQVEGEEGASRSMSIARDSAASTSFTNRYAPSPAQVPSVTGEKRVVGIELADGDSFGYLVEQVVDDERIELGRFDVVCTMQEIDGAMVMDPASLRFDATAIVRAAKLDAPGEYLFAITEVDSSLDEEASGAEARFRVVVGDSDMDGSLEVQGITTDTESIVSISGDFDVFLLFEDSYVSEDEAVATVNIALSIDDRSDSGISPEGFEFVLSDGESGDAIAAVLTDDVGAASIALTFGQDDIGVPHAYTLAQVHGGETIDALTHDGSVHDIHVDATLDGAGNMALDVRGEKREDAEGGSDTGADGPSQQGSADNLRDSDSTADQGSTGTAGQGSVGAVEPDPVEAAGPDSTGASGRNSVGADDPGLTGTSGQGSAEGSGQDSTSAQQASEPSDDRLQPARSRIELPGAGTVVTGGISDAGDATVLTQEDDGSSGPSYDAPFVNVYDPEDADVTLSGMTLLVGGELQKRQFLMSLYRTGSTFDTSGLEPEQTVANVDSKGNFSFETMTFDKVGTYYFVIVEKQEVNGGSAAGTTAGEAGGARIEFDTRLYRVVIRVSDRNGRLVAQTSVFNEDGEPSVLTFLNHAANNSGETPTDNSSSGGNGGDSSGGGGQQPALPASDVPAPATPSSGTEEPDADSNTIRDASEANDSVRNANPANDDTQDASNTQDAETRKSRANPSPSATATAERNARQHDASTSTGQDSQQPSASGLSAVTGDPLRSALVATLALMAASLLAIAMRFISQVIQIGRFLKPRR